MKQMTHDEKVTEKIALLLLSIPKEGRNEICHNALDFTCRAEFGWWEVIGRPHLNKQLASLRRKVEKMKK